MDQLDAMRIYLRVTELASFSLAAETLGLPKASVSTAVQRLEERLGTRLLHRTTRRVQPTPDGQAFYERCRDLLADMDELQQMFRAGPQALSGRLRVDMSSGVARHAVLPRLPEFLQAHPRLSIEFSSTDRKVDLVREGFDCVLRVGVLADSSLIARPLGYFRLLNCASRDYLLRYGEPTRLDELAQHQLIHYQPILGGRSTGFAYLDAAGVERSLAMAGAISVNNADAYLGACLAGLGLIQVPRLGVAEHLDSGRLVELLPAYQAAPLPVTLLYAHRRQLPRRVQVFMEWMETVLQPYLLPWDGGASLVGQK
ncbi:LysR family transcriptional regulator [Chitinimonas lacunae]|uniref:LysR family transcriptional regulator n=1 Tax=Chitinimonas lacunae TaxID=1963018 RepID=A0ABV8MNG7_9NEIS